MDDTSLIRKLIEDFKLGAESVHGPAHWGRVLEIGLELAKHTGADTDVVTLFAVFHDLSLIHI